MNNRKTIVVFIISIMMIATITVTSRKDISFPPLSYGQAQSQTSNANTKPLPVLLIHGYLWLMHQLGKYGKIYLRKMAFNTFQSHSTNQMTNVGPRADHAKELGSQIKQVLPRDNRI